jgi:hypothetical protein
MGFKPCWSYGSNAACYDGCECAKCVDPDGYARWRCECPEEYEDWLERQREDD